MAIAPLQIPQAGQLTPNIDWSPLAQLGTQYQQAKTDSARKDALSLANLGQGGTQNWSGAVNSLMSIGDIDGATKLATIQKSLQPENSADLQAYKVAQGQGYTGGILDFLKSKAEAGAAKTSINNTTNVPAGEKSFDQAVGKDYGETFTGIQKAGRDSVGAINNLNLMDKLIDNPNFYSGTGGNLVTQAKKTAAALGIADADSAAPNEVFQKLSQKTVLDAAGGSLGTGFSNADRDFLNGTVANINNTPAGNKAIIGMARTVEQRKQQVSQFARDYAKAHGGRIDSGFDGALQDWANKNPAFPQAQPQGDQQQQAQPQAPQQPQQQAQPRQAPDGKFYVPDPNRPGKYLQVVQ